MAEDSVLSLDKAGKTIGLLAANVAKQEVELHCKDLEIARLKPMKRKRVSIDSNSKFANIEDLKKAQDQARREHVPKKSRKETLFLKEGKTVANWAHVLRDQLMVIDTRASPKVKSVNYSNLPKELRKNPSPDIYTHLRCLV